MLSLPGQPTPLTVAQLPALRSRCEFMAFGFEFATLWCKKVTLGYQVATFRCGLLTLGYSLSRASAPAACLHGNLLPRTPRPAGPQGCHGCVAAASAPRPRPRPTRRPCQERRVLQSASGLAPGRADALSPAEGGT
eukprot:6362027-Pyramimonas_sp.AAC.1